MPLAFDDLRFSGGYGPERFVPSPEDERSFPHSAYPCHDPEHTSLTGQILFWFNHAAQGATLLLDSSLHACFTCSLRRHMASLPMEEDDRYTLRKLATQGAELYWKLYPGHEVVIIVVEVYAEDGDHEGAVEALAWKKTMSEDPCAICLKGFGKGREASMIPCPHVFHDDCIRKWLEKSKSCPICRSEVRISKVIGGDYFLF